MENRWICSRRWDLGWLVGSALLVPVAPLLHHFGMTPENIAMAILLVVGGPHVAVTFTRTNMDPKFVRSHRWLSRGVFLVPLLTAWFALSYTPLFLTFFFTWASLHVLQQIAYVSNCYSNRQKITPTRTERLFEYGLIFSCLYPFATFRMWEGTFLLDGTRLLVPEALVGPGLLVAAFAVFGFFLSGWLVYVVRRARREALHFGKTALLGATVLATFFTPLFQNLDVAFQGINAWHCVQYLALIWWANRLRRERGEEQYPFMRALSEGGWRGFARYYGSAVAATALIVAVILLVVEFAGVSELLAYYMVGKGLLLSHYYYDTFLFVQSDELVVPGAVPQAVAA